MMYGDACKSRWVELGGESGSSLAGTVSGGSDFTSLLMLMLLAAATPSICNGLPALFIQFC